MNFWSDNGDDYNNCLFACFFPLGPRQMQGWSAADLGMVRTVFNNFEIADVDLWRGEAYTAFLNYLDHNGRYVLHRYSSI